MKIAGTDFEMCDPTALWSQVVQRVARTASPLHVLDRAFDAVHNEDAVSLGCQDGLVIMTLQSDSDGTITAVVLLAVSFGDAGAFKRQEDAMVMVAKEAGASRMAFRTDRRGWIRLLGPAWRLDGETFSRSV